MPLAQCTEALAASEPRRTAPERQGAAVATNAEGLRLHLSSSNSTGYRGVLRDAAGRFSVDAAVAYARAVGGHLPPAPPAPPATPAVATEAEGLQLHLSSLDA